MLRATKTAIELCEVQGWELKGVAKSGKTGIVSIRARGSLADDSPDTVRKISVTIAPPVAVTAIADEEDSED
jgi:hypothetical protein